MDNFKLIFVGDKDVKSFKYNGETFRPYYVINGNVDMEARNKYCNNITSKMKGYKFEDFENASRKAGNIANSKGIIIYACISGENNEKVLGLVYPCMKELYDWNIKGKTKIVSEKEELKPISTKYFVKTKNKIVMSLFRDRGNKILQDGKDYVIMPTDNNNDKTKYRKVYRDDYKYKNYNVSNKIVDTETGQEMEVKVNVIVNGKERALEGIRVFVDSENHAYFKIIDKQVFTGNDVFYMETWYNDGDIIPAKANSKIQSMRIYEWGV